MIRRSTIIINWLLLILMLSVNVLASKSLLNGLSTKDVSDRYPNFFVPAGFTFSIWSVIYVLLIGFVIQGTILAKRNSVATGAKLVNEISPFFQLTCLLNAGWIFAWQFLQIELSVIIMLGFLTVLILIYIKLQSSRSQLKPAQYVWLYLPFAVYLGWISVATIANITALLVYLGWSGFGIAEVHWSYIMIGAATILGLLFSLARREWAYTLVIVWALYGIFSAQKQKPGTEQAVPLLALALLIASVLITYLRRKRQLL